MGRIGYMLAALVAAASLPGGAATAQEPRVFTPDGPWAMDYADDSCRLVRNFVNRDEKLTLALERYAPGESLLVMVVGNGFKRWRSATSVKFAFGPEGEPVEHPLFYTELTDGQAAFVLGEISLVPPPPDWKDLSEEERRAQMRKPVPREEELDRATKVSELRITYGVTAPTTLELGTMRAPLSAMHACTSDLVARWGLDSKRHDSLMQRATPTNDFAKLARQFYYPFEALRYARDGVVRFRLMVDANGAPTSCRIQAPSGPAEFVRSTCDTLMRNMTFEAARDANNTPIPSYWASSVRFQIAR